MRAPTTTRKVTFIGPEGAGRSGLMHRLKENENKNENENNTYTLDFGFLTTKNNEKIKIQDLNGTKRFEGVRGKLLKGEKDKEGEEVDKQDLIVIVVNKHQYDEIKNFLAEIDAAYPDKTTRPPIGLVITDLPLEQGVNFNKEEFCGENFARFDFVYERNVNDIVPGLRAQILNPSKLLLVVKPELKKLQLAELVNFIHNKNKEGGLNDTHVCDVIHHMSIDQGTRSDFKYTSDLDPDIAFSLHENKNACVINIEKILNFNEKSTSTESINGDNFSNLIGGMLSNKKLYEEEIDCIQIPIAIDNIM